MNERREAMPAHAQISLPVFHPFTGMDVWTLLESHASTQPDSPFLIWQPFDAEAVSWTFAQFHAHARAIAATTNTRSAAEEFAFFVDNAGASAAITQPRYRAMVEDALGGSMVAVIDADPQDPTPYTPNAPSPDG